MKNKIILLSICVAISVSSFLFGVQWEKNKYESDSFARSFQEESFRVIVYYNFLRKYDSGKEVQAVNEIRGWLESDLALIETYKDRLSDTDRKRALRLIEVVQPYRGKSNK